MPARRCGFAGGRIEMPDAWEVAHFEAMLRGCMSLTKEGDWVPVDHPEAIVLLRVRTGREADAGA